MKNKNYMEYILFGIFAVVGAIVIVMGIATTISGMRFKETAEEITGIISEIDSYRDSDGDRHYSVFVNYTIPKMVNIHM